MKSDFHLHSEFSGDSDTPMSAMIEKAISLGLETICFTEHLDLDYPDPAEDFSLNTPSYYHTLCELKKRYAPDIEILFGVELGMQHHLGERYDAYAREFPFDYILASQHVLDQADPYYSAFWEGKHPADVICHYFEETLQNLKGMTEYDTLAHLDYIVRYAGKGNTSYDYSEYCDVIDPILHYLIEQGKCLEVNTAGLKYGLGQTNPSTEVLKRYRELGGESITIGSDGHKPEHLAYDFHLLPDLLTSLGFRYHCIFRNRTASYIKI